MGQVSSEFKSAFGKILVILSLQKTADYTVNPFMEYMTSLITLTRAALLTEGKFDQYKKVFDDAEKEMNYLYDDVLPKSNASLWQQAEVRRACFKVTNLILPVALGEGILILNEETFNIANIMGGVNSGDETLK